MLNIQKWVGFLLIIFTFSTASAQFTGAEVRPDTISDGTFYSGTPSNPDEVNPNETARYIIKQPNKYVQSQYGTNYAFTFDAISQGGRNVEHLGFWCDPSNHLIYVNPSDSLTDTLVCVELTIHDYNAGTDTLISRCITVTTLATQTPIFSNATYYFNTSNPDEMRSYLASESIVLDSTSAGVRHYTFNDHLHIIEEGGLIHSIQQSDTLLLYDFNLEVGDTFRNNDVPYPMYVDSVDEVTLNGMNRKRLFLEVVGNIGGIDQVFIEGVGSVTSGFDYLKTYTEAGAGLIGICTDDKSYKLDILSNDMLSEVDDTMCNSWYKLVGVKSVNNARFSVYPNPNAGHIIISNPNRLDFTYILYDLRGSMIAVGHSVDQHCELQFEGSEGVYYLELISAEGRRYRTKLIKLGE